MTATRKLVAILCSDVVGYSRLAGADEDPILARLRALRSDLIDPTNTVHKGRVVCGLPVRWPPIGRPRGWTRPPCQIHERRRHDRTARPRAAAADCEESDVRARVQSFYLAHYDMDRSIAASRKAFRERVPRQTFAALTRVGGGTWTRNAKLAEGPLGSAGTVR